MSLTASLLKHQSADVKTKIAEDVEKIIWPLFHSKGIQPVIYKKLPLQDAAKAHMLWKAVHTLENFY